jgi:alkylated DNA repair dioxygenase AlkB
MDARKSRFPSGPVSSWTSHRDSRGKPAPSALFILGVASGVRYQPTLFGGAGPATGASDAFDGRFASLRRIHLDGSAWIDLAPGWVAAADSLFEQVLAAKEWSQRSRWMYDHEVLEPRMTARWTLDSGEPLKPAILEQMRLALSARYGVLFDSVGFNLYRDGGDSVAWHRDKIRKEVPNPIVPLLSLGEPRKLHFRPRGGGPSRSFPVGHGDLLVTGGSTQRAWEHAVLKVARGGARISVAFRYGVDRRAYDPIPSP